MDAIEITIELTREEREALKAMLERGLAPRSIWPEQTALRKLQEELNR